MKTKLPTMALQAAAGLIISSAGTANAAAVAGWQFIFDGDNDASSVGTTLTTASPDLDHAQKSAIAANFTSATLADGDSLTMTGTVSFSAVLSQGAFRFGLFDGDNPVMAGDGTGYAGYYAEAGVGSARSIATHDGTGVSHPFTTGSGSGTNIASMSGGTAPAAAADLDFFMTLTRDGSLMNVSAGITNGGTYTSTGSVTGTPAIPASAYTFDSAGFVMTGSGGAWAGTTATFTNIDVTHTLAIVPEPSSTALLGLGGLALILRRRR